MGVYMYGCVYVWVCICMGVYMYGCVYNSVDVYSLAYRVHS